MTVVNKMPFCSTVTSGFPTPKELHSMAVYIGVDFHARQQTIRYLKTEDGEIQRARLEHAIDDVGQQKIREFYSQFKEEVIVGIETGGYSQWFEKMLEELGHEVWVGDAGQVRRLAVRKQKNDRLDAAHILDLMISGRFPRVSRRSRHSCEVLGQIGYRHKLVKMRTMSINSLRAISVGAGLIYTRQLQSERGRARLKAVNLSPV